jgi:hypothetical protein
MDLGPWRDVALILLILETALVILPVGAVLYLSVRALLYLKRLAREYLPLAQEYARRVATTTDRVCRILVRPMVTLEAWRAQAGAIGNAALRTPEQRRNR